MDILLINGMEFLYSTNPSPYIGHYILEKILKEEHIQAGQINIDAERQSGRIRLSNDPDVMFGEAADFILSKQPKIVGFNTICSSFITAVQISMKIHRKAPDVKIIFGGPHATITAAQCLRDLDFLTLVCLGESEYSIVPVVKALLSGAPLDEVPGIAYRKDGKIVSNPCCDLVPAEKLADYTVIDYGGDFRSLSVPHTIEGGRGCPFHCSFCSTSMFWQRKFRIKPVDALIAEMDQCHETLGTDAFAIEHDMFTANRKYISEFCARLIGRGAPYRWRCSSRVDVLDEELIARMAEAGCTYVFLGIESGSDRMQRIINKHLNLDNAVQMTKCLLKNGISVTASFIYGFPDETEDDFLGSVQLMQRLLLAGTENLQFHPFMLLPGTEETAKVKSRAFFNEMDVDLSIYNRSVINEESRELIRRYKDIFIQYYTFESEVRKKYPWFEALFAIVSLQWNHFRHTFTALAETVGLTQLYLRYEELFRDFYFQFNGLDCSGSILPVIRDYLKKIVLSENTDRLGEIFRFENDLFDYVHTNCQEMLFRKYRLDINIPQNRCAALPEGRSYAIRRTEGSKISVLPVPTWIAVE